MSYSVLLVEDDSQEAMAAALPALWESSQLPSIFGGESASAAELQQELLDGRKYFKGNAAEARGVEEARLRHAQAIEVRPLSELV